MAPPICSDCARILSGSYYEAGKRLLCAPCGEKLKAGGATTPGFLGLFPRKLAVRGPIPLGNPMPPPGQV